jgi:hypothetical protein
LGVKPLAHTLPVLLTERNRTPLCSFTEVIQVSTADFTQFGYRHSSHVTALAYQIRQDPVILPELKVFDLDGTTSARRKP